MTRKRWAQLLTFGAGLVYLLTSLSMFVAPRWFFETVGHWPPFNRHYIGDVAAFLLVPALGLMVAARDPAGRRLWLWTALLASAVHTANHVADLFGSAAHLTHWLTDLGPLLLIVAALTAAYVTDGEGAALERA